MQGRIRPSRLATLAATAGLVLSLVATAAPAIAADTRTISVGSPDSAGVVTHGLLTFTPVSAGQSTKTDIRVTNLGGQTLTKATLSIGIAPGAALPDDVIVSAVFGANAGSCEIAEDDRSVVCSFGNLPKKQSRNVSVVLDFPAAGTLALDPHVAAVKVNENVNDNGANTDTFYASATLNVAAPSCESVATFVAPGLAKQVSTDTSGLDCVPQTTALDIPALGNGAKVIISEQTDESCTGALTCFGQASVVNVNDGATVGLRWSVTWPMSIIPSGFNENNAVIVHFLDGTAGNRVIANKGAGLCGSNVNKTNCIESVDEEDGFLTIIFRTPTNGKVRGGF